MVNQLSISIITALVQSLSNGVVMFDPQKNVLLANPAAVRFTGLPGEGYNLSELFILFSNVPLEKMVDEVLTSEKINHVKEAYVPPFIYDIVIVPVKDDTNKIIGGAFILHDITDVKKVEQQLNERSNEVEEMNKLMIGRELKMEDLENENEELKKEMNVLKIKIPQ